MPICTTCKTDKNKDEFPFLNKKSGIKHPRCKKCCNISIRKHYHNNKEYYLKKTLLRNKNKRLENKAKIASYLNDHPCVDCGEKDPIVLEFDHVRGEKKHNISKMISSTYNWNTIFQEISKCEVRCANCHVRKTAKQFGWTK